jgi:hypothetical protein
MISKLNEKYYIRLYASAEKQIVLSNGKVFSSEDLEDVIYLVPAPKEIQKKMAEASDADRVSVYRNWLEQEVEAETAHVKKNLQYRLDAFNTFINHHEGWDMEWGAMNV